jgi:hypothetical protein
MGASPSTGEIYIGEELGIYGRGPENQGWQKKLGLGCRTLTVVVWKFWDGLGCLLPSGAACTCVLGPVMFSRLCQIVGHAARSTGVRQQLSKATLSAGTRHSAVRMAWPALQE